MSILLLGVLVSFVVPIMLGLITIGGKSTNQISSSVTTQQVVERIKGAWQNRACYDNNIVPNLSLTGVNLSAFTLDQRAATPAAAAAPSAAASCTAATPSTATPPFFRRITVSTGSAAQDTLLTLDIRRP